jgi:hypothetical protein
MKTDLVQLLTELQDQTFHLATHYTQQAHALHKSREEFSVNHVCPTRQVLAAAIAIDSEIASRLEAVGHALTEAIALTEFERHKYPSFASFARPHNN